jgi:HK97 family phage major capsid protein
MSKALITKLIEERSKKETRFVELTTHMESRALSDEENTEFDGLVAELRSFDERIEQLDQVEIRSEKVAETRKRLGITDGDAPAAVVTSEERTYRKGTGASYYRDLYFSQKGDVEAAQRLHRHAKEVEVESRKAGTFEARAMNRTDGTGGTFVPPSYLIDDYAALARAGRPFANACRNLELPSGTDSVNIPRITQGSLVGVQATDNGVVATQDMNDAYVTAPVITEAGAVTLPLQLIDQSPIAFDEVVFADLTAEYGRQVDLQALSGSGAGGNAQGTLGTAGINAVTYTSASPTVAALYSKLADAIQQIHTGRFLPPTAVWMHPRRWAWFLAAADSSNRPLVVPSAGGPNNALANLTAVHSEGSVGTIQGLPVFVDASIPTNLGAGTNEDRIIVARMDDLWLMEGALRSRVLEQTKGDTLSVLLQVYAYLAFTAGRYAKATSVISGTGLVAPTF